LFYDAEHGGHLGGFSAPLPDSGSQPKEISMINKFAAATAVAFFVSTGAMAASTSATATGVPSDWPASLKDAFFSDSSGTKLRSQAEIRTKWAALSSAQKTQVKTDCQKMASNTGTSTETTASTTKKTTTSGSSTAATAAGGDQMAMNQLCTMVKGM
jgi:hypothetical protein